MVKIKDNYPSLTFWITYYPLIFICLYSVVESFGDAIMSYATPIYLEQILGNPKTMGLVFASSSLFGILADLLLGSLFRSQKYIFFMLGSAIIGICFPLIFLLLPPNIAFLILAMAIWGIYYEMIRFGRFKFIPRFFSKDNHALSWGLITIFSALAVTLSPIFASRILEQGFNKVFIFAIPFYILSFLIILFFYFSKNKKNYIQTPTITFDTKHYQDIFGSVKSWKIFIKSLWLILLFIFIISVIDSAFWTIGALLSEQLKNYGPGLLLFLYSAPSLFVGLFTARFGKPFGKKRAAFISGILSGIFMVFMGLSSKPLLLLTFTFISSLFISIAWPEIDAVMEDFVARVGKSSSDLVGVQGLSINLGYVLGPVFAGFIADYLGIRQTFAVLGAGLTLISLISLLLVPRKVRLPEKQLQEVV
jgi:MFS family permease